MPEKKDECKSHVFTADKKGFRADKALGKSLRISLTYLIFGALWITVTDMLSEHIFVRGVLAISLVKGLFYVLITSLLIFFLVYPTLKKYLRAQEDLLALNERLKASVISLEEEREKLRDSEARIKTSEALFRAVFDQVPIGVAIVDNDKYIIAPYKDYPGMNPKYAQITGRTKEQWALTSWKDATHPEDLPKDVELYEKFRSGEINGYNMDKRYIRSDGSLTWTHMTVAPLVLHGRDDLCHICIIEDINERKRIEDELCDSERSKAVLLDNLPGMAYRCAYDQNWTMHFVSGGCFELTGYEAESLLHNRVLSFNQLIMPAYREYLWDKWDTVIKSRGKLQEEYEIVTASGEIKWVWEQGQGIYDEQGHVLALEGLIIDITSRKKYELQLKHLNNHDVLTNIFNRRHLQETLAADRGTGGGEGRAFILINIRRFSLINTTYGYTYGESLVRELAGRLQCFADDNTQLFHVSIDRFVLYRRKYGGREELHSLCGAVSTMMNAMYTPRAVNGSIGVVEIERDEYELEAILKKASIAAENSDDGMNFGCGYYNSEMEMKISRKIKITDALNRIAYDSGTDCFFMHFQPILSLSDGKIFGFEALARFRHDEYSFVPPDEFIPIAEQSQLIVPLGIIIMRRSFEFLKRLERGGYGGVFITINISPLQLLRDDFIPYLEYTAALYGINVRSIIIEITESIFMDNFDKVNKTLRDIRTLGARIAIDDFGTGYSSLAREGELDIDFLKIDKYFIDKLNEKDPEHVITADIISMAHKLGHYVIAEGVESEKQRDYLIRSKCDMMQGYLYSRPVDEDTAFGLLSGEI